jgi:hypothetical protein
MGPERLAPGQKREWEFMWALSPADPGAARTVVVATRSVDGRLDHVALWRAFADVIRRHDACSMTADGSILFTAGEDGTIRA